MTSQQRIKSEKVIAARILDAQVIHNITMDEAKQLPGLLGRFVPATLKHVGYYTCTLDGVKTLFIERKS